MQIQFDPRDRNACSAVLAAIMGLHGELPMLAGAIVPYGDDEETADTATVTVRPGDQVDASEAFDAPDPAAAFPPAAAAPIAPPATSAPLPPAGTQGDGTAATTPPAGADNGQAAAPTASPSNAVELDAKGLPWDGRIHAGKASAPIKVGDGSWRKKRGVDAALVTQVEAELRQVMAAPGPNAAPPANAAGSPEPAPAPAPTAAPAAPTPTPPAAGMEHGAVAATTAPSAPPAPPVAAPPVQAAVPIAEQAPAAPPVAAAPAPAAEAGPLTLPVLMRKITALQTAGTLDVAGTNAIAVSLGLTSVRDLVQRPDLIATFDALLPEQVA